MDIYIYLVHDPDSEPMKSFKLRNEHDDIVENVLFTNDPHAYDWNQSINVHARQPKVCQTTACDAA